MIQAKLPAMRGTLINGAKSMNNSTEGDLFGEKYIYYEKKEREMSF